jgi:hypothetical protein
VYSSGEFRIVALAPLAVDEWILSLDGELLRRPTRYSVQIDRDLHIDVPPADQRLEEILECYPWRFLNHSCSPSARVHGCDVVAIRPIAQWDEITFNYNTTEYELTCPFRCRCPDCEHGEGREIGGFRRLDRVERERLRPWLAGHLLERLDSGEDGSAG